MSDTEEYKNVWDALADTPEEGANLRLRSELMNEVSSFIEDRHWTQSEAAARCGITQPRTADLLRGRISKFSLDALVNIAASLGRTVRMRVGTPDSSLLCGNAAADNVSNERPIG